MLRPILICLSLGLALLPAACLYVPRPVEGVSNAEPWFVLPLRGFLAEGRAEPEAIAACAVAECGDRLAVGVVRLNGAQAAATAALLREPQRLKRELEERDAEDTEPRRKAIRTTVEVVPFSVADLPGFALTLARADGSRPPAHAVMIGRSEAQDLLRVVLVVGLDPQAVEATARQVAARYLQS